MFELTLSESATIALAQAVRESGLPAPVVSLSQAATNVGADGLTHHVAAGSSDSALLEAGLSTNRSKLVPVKWRVEAGVFPREQVPHDHLIDAHGFWFSFSPEWQKLIVGGALDFKDDSFLLADASGNIILPLDLQRYTNARA